jgi:Protein of unknown function (DUF1861)
MTFIETEEVGIAIQQQCIDTVYLSPTTETFLTQVGYDVDELLADYRRKPPPGLGRLVTLNGITDLDGYNPSNPMVDGSQSYAYVRVEPRHDEFASWCVPFRQVEDAVWHIDEDIPMLRLQDPFAARIHGWLVVGGVRIVTKRRDELVWETVFFRGTSPADLEEFARSPRRMKDVRLVALENGRVGVFTRPLESVAGRGRIGYMELRNLDDLATSALAEAPLLEIQPVRDHWWGANAVYDLGDGKLGVLGHIAKFGDASRHYYAIAFVFDRYTLKIVQGPHIIADRSCFPAHPAKRPDLEDVIFPAWIDREKGILFAGLSDTTIGMVSIADPFSP